MTNSPSRRPRRYTEVYNLRLDPETKSRLEQLAEDSGVPAAIHAPKAIEEYLDRKEATYGL